jgi:Mn2+/Fe2+ NRAMP family transporter
MLVTAAFIGPGTVLTASQAGAKYGFSLLWTVAFATITGIILQEMASRLGIATGSGFSQAIRGAFKNQFLCWSVLSLVLLGILFGNSAYQTGNLIGAAAGIDALSRNWSGEEVERASVRLRSSSSELSSVPSRSWGQVEKAYSVIPLLGVGALAGALIIVGRFEWLQRVLTLLVVFMSLTFLLAAGLSWPSLAEIGAGLWPSIPPNSELLIIGLIGTTVVPYNLFLHASAASQRWPRDAVRRTADREQAVRVSAKNTRIAVGIGGIITAAIMITAAAAFEPIRAAGPVKTGFNGLASVAEIAVQLEPAVGSWATAMFGLGLFAAGLTSAITAPVAAAYAVGGSFNWPPVLTHWRMKFVALAVLLIGLGFALKFGAAPKEAVLVAQSLNGLLLPVLAIALLVIVNRVDIMTRFYNRPLQNLLAVTTILVVTLIAARQVGIFKLSSD